MLIKVLIETAIIKKITAPDPSDNLLLTVRLPFILMVPF